MSSAAATFDFGFRRESSPPTSIQAGGSPERSVLRAGAAAGSTASVPQRSPSSACQPSRLAQPSKTPMSSTSSQEAVSQRSSSIG